MSENLTELSIPLETGSNRDKFSNAEGYFGLFIGFLSVFRQSVFVSFVKSSLKS